ncbi:transcriptional regulator [Serratia marcescens]|uniref:transcriptional regulator n=1 Tax=Serratia marcescens TaxID=615 RepID=UPI0027E3B730|nr:transcriptional regulator [Serratia marcescens]
MRNDKFCLHGIYQKDKLTLSLNKKVNLMSNDLLRWRQSASKGDWKRLAQLSRTTTGYLDQIAYSNRRASPDMAERIEMATREFPEIKPVSKEVLVFAVLKEKAA